MLKALEIRNYQSHRNTAIEFHRGLNVITGISSHGKSSIIRSMLWAINNRPSGDAFKSWAATEKDNVEVAMEFDNDWFIKKRVKDKNSYECDGGTFTALRTDVPDTIQEICNITDYNIQTQHEPFFMIQETGGERAKRLNQLVGLDIVDRVFKWFNSKVSSTKQDTERIDKEIKTLEEEIEELKFLDSVELQLTKIEKCSAEIEKAEGRANQLESLLIRYDEIEAEIKKKSEVLKTEQSYKVLLVSINHYQEDLKFVTWVASQKEQLKIVMEKLADTQYLQELSARHHSIQTGLSAYQFSINTNIRLKDTIKNYKSIESDLKDTEDWLAVDKRYTSMINQINEYVGIKVDVQPLSSIITSLGNIQHSIPFKEQEVGRLVTLKKELLADLGVCPTCGQIYID